MAKAINKTTSTYVGVGTAMDSAHETALEQVFAKADADAEYRQKIVAELRTAAANLRSKIPVDAMKLGNLLAAASAYASAHKAEVPRSALSQLAARSSKSEVSGSAQLQQRCSTCGLSYKDICAGKPHLYGECRDAGQQPRPVETAGPVSRLDNVPGKGLREPFVLMCDDQSEPP